MSKSKPSLKIVEDIIVELQKSYVLSAKANLVIQQRNQSCGRNAIYDVFFKWKVICSSSVHGLQ